MQPQPFSPTPAPRPKLTPSAGWFWLGGGLIGLGIIAGIAFIAVAVVRYTDKIDDFQRVEAPGSGSIELEETGGYTVYLEYPGASEDSFLSTPNVSLTAPDGSQVLLEDYDSDVTYDVGSHDGIALYSFDADEPGIYQLETAGDPFMTIAVGRGLGSAMVGLIVAGVVIGFLGFVGGLIIIIVVAVRRSRNRRMLLWQQSGGQPGGPPPSGPQWGPRAPQQPGGQWGAGYQQTGTQWGGGYQQAGTQWGGGYQQPSPPPAQTPSSSPPAAPPAAPPPP